MIENREYFKVEEFDGSLSFYIWSTNSGSEMIGWVANVTQLGNIQMSVRQWQFKCHKCTGFNMDMLRLFRFMATLFFFQDCRPREIFGILLCFQVVEGWILWC